ncbi:MAG: hypothetical protein GXO82_09840 [Chlorobi bacterium]|nr:hypothetical protein [Chlorobiota bacterium]
MPWIFKSLLVISLLSAPLVVFVLFRVGRAVRGLYAGKLAHIKRAYALVFIVMYAFPVVVFTAYFLQEWQTLEALRGGRTLISLVLVYSFWAGLAIAAQSAVLIFPVWLTGVLVRKLRAGWRTRWDRVESWTVLVITILVTAYVPLRMYYDTHMVHVDRIEYVLPGLSRDLDGLRIVVISDLQADEFTGAARVRSYIDVVNEQHPDIVLFAGDLITSGKAYIPFAARSMKSIQSRYGVFACLGDHDYWSGADSVRAALEDAGITVGENETRYVTIDRARVAISMATQVYGIRLGVGELDAMEKEAGAADLSLLVIHQPVTDIVERAAETYQVIAAGHTHGGQIAVSVFGWRVTGSMVETRFISGFYRVDTALVYVCNGLGMSLVPVRLNSTPTVGVIVLRAE